MKTQILPSVRRAIAFTLIELLVVIAIIGILAAMLFPAGAAIKRKAAMKKAQIELKSLAMAIDSYKSKFGYYPPGPGGAHIISNSLYFELSGVNVAVVGGVTNFVTLDEAARITQPAVLTTFGQGGILNYTKGSVDDGLPAVAFLKELKPGQSAGLPSGPRILTCSVLWPVQNGEIVANLPGVNPWRYMVTGATNNPGNYDLWVDIVLSGKTNRISNWSETPELVP